MYKQKSDNGKFHSRILQKSPQTFVNCINTGYSDLMENSINYPSFFQVEYDGCSASFLLQNLKLINLIHNNPA